MAQVLVPLNPYENPGKDPGFQLQNGPDPVVTAIRRLIQPMEELALSLLLTMTLPFNKANFLKETFKYNKLRYFKFDS